MLFKNSYFKLELEIVVNVMKLIITISYQLVLDLVVLVIVKSISIISPYLISLLLDLVILSYLVIQFQISINLDFVDLNSNFINLTIWPTILNLNRPYVKIFLLFFHKAFHIFIIQQKLKTMFYILIYIIQGIGCIQI